MSRNNLHLASWKYKISCMKKILIVMLVAVAISFSSHAQKYAIIDTKYILSKMPEYVDADKKLQAISDQ